MNAILGAGTDSAKISVDTERLIASRLLVQANSGGGKSWTIRRLLEQTHGQLQHIIIDPEGEFHTLREKFDYILAAPTGGDCAAHPKTAKMLAHKLLELGVSAIVDIYELKPHERKLFVRLFLEALVNAPKKLWHPALVVIDEAHVFCPQTGQAESAGAVIDLMTRGRKRGYCGVLATQRISKLHKDAAAEANNKLIGRTGLDIDMKRAGDELGFSSKDDIRSLRALEAGQFFAFGPAISNTVTKIKIGNVKTTHPQAGQESMSPPPPSAKVKSMLLQLADIPKEAEREVKTNDDLRKEVRNLKSELTRSKKVNPAPDPEALNKAHAQGFGEAQKAHSVTIKAVQKAVAVLERGPVDSLSANLFKLRELLDEEMPLMGPIKTSPQRPATMRTVPTPKASAETTGDISNPQQRILDAIMWFKEIDRVPTRVQVAFMAGSSPRSSGFTNNLSNLRTKGLIDYPSGGMLSLTDDGEATANTPDAPTTSEELHQAILGRVSQPQGRIIRALIECHPDDLSRDELAEQADASPRSSGFTNNLSALRTLGLLDYSSPGRVIAQPELFLD